MIAKKMRVRKSNLFWTTFKWLLPLFYWKAFKLVMIYFFILYAVGDWLAQGYQAEIISNQ